MQRQPRRPMQFGQIFSFTVDEDVKISPEVDLVLLLASLESGLARESAPIVVSMAHDHPQRNIADYGISPFQLTSRMILCTLLEGVTDQVQLYIPLPSGGTYIFHRRGQAKVHIMIGHVLEDSFSWDLPRTNTSSVQPLVALPQPGSPVRSSQMSTPPIPVNISSSTAFNETRPRNLPHEQNTTHPFTNPYANSVTSVPPYDSNLSSPIGHNGEASSAQPRVPQCENTAANVAGHSNSFTPPPPRHDKPNSNEIVQGSSRRPYSEQSAATSPSSPSGGKAVSTPSRKKTNTPYKRKEEFKVARKVDVKMMNKGDSDGPSVSFGSIIQVKYELFNLVSKQQYCRRDGENLMKISMNDIGQPAGIKDAVFGMCVNETRKANIPWEKGFGVQGCDQYQVPPRSDLRFVCTLISID